MDIKNEFEMSLGKNLIVSIIDSFVSAFFFNMVAMAIFSRILVYSFFLANVRQTIVG